MKQEDRLLTKEELLNAVEVSGVRAAQDTKSIKLRDKEWVVEVEKLNCSHYTTHILIDLKDWQTLKSKMGVEDENT